MDNSDIKRFYDRMLHENFYVKQQVFNKWAYLIHFIKDSYKTLLFELENYVFLSLTNWDVQPLICGYNHLQYIST